MAGADSAPNSARSLASVEPTPRAETPPPSPARRGKFKSRLAAAASRSLSSRTSSLRDTKVLLVTDSAQLRRTDSVQNPDMFGYSDHFQLVGLVGRTARSEVWKVRHRASGELFAIKRQTQRFKSKLHRSRCMREIKTVAALPPHPNVVQTYRAWQEGGHFHIQMDFCEGGSLQQEIAAGAALGRPLEDGQLWRLAWDAAAGLDFLHSHRILHLDIKPDNLYLTATGDCRIGDFGLAIANEDRSDWEEGDGAFVAPELLQVGGEPSPAADVFSLGATLYAAATGEQLARGEGAGLAEAALPGRPPAFQQLVRSMLQRAPEARPSASQVCQFAVQFLLQAGGADGTALAAPPAAAAAAAPPAPLGRPAQAPHASPFDQRGDGAGEGLGEATGEVQPADAAVAAAVLEQHWLQEQERAKLSAAFSFDVPARPAGAAAEETPAPLLHPRAPRRGTSTPLGAWNQQRWVPGLSPIQGGLTPGAGATPPFAGASASPGFQAPPPTQRKKPPPLQLPPSCLGMGMGSGEFMSSGGGTARVTPSSATPELFRQPGSGGSAAAAADPPSEEAAPAVAAAAAAPRQPALLGKAPSLAWDLHTSPEFLMQLPPGSASPAASLSRSSSIAEASNQVARCLGSVRQKLLDSMPSMGQSDEALAALAAQPLSSRFDSTLSTGIPKPPGLLRKRHHSSRRGLMGMLSRDTSCASSLDLQPALKTRATAPRPEAGDSPAAGAGASGSDAPSHSSQRAPSSALCAPMTELRLRDQ
eukprot:scaffold22.g6047.t1